VRLKKRFGQHFLRDTSVIHAMLAAVRIDVTTSVMEIGCGDGFLTKHILRQLPARLWGFEIDNEWANHVENTYAGNRLRVLRQDFLSADMQMLEPYAPWLILANLPYNITFPILYRLQAYRTLFSHGVLMMQDEVAQKIIQTSGRGYGFPSLFLQHYFTWKLLRKVPPDSFYPAPQVMSRLVYIEPIVSPEDIPHEHAFWNFVQACFTRPRKTLRNNLKQAGYPCDIFSAQILDLRAQQLKKDQFIAIWKQVYQHLL